MSATLMSTWQRLLAELASEAASTRRVLGRIPQEQLSWRPHPKSMSLGQLALHVAVLPGAIATLLSEPVTQVREVPLPEATSVAQLLEALEQSVATGTAALERWGEEGLFADWSMKAGDRTLMTMPRIDAVRMIMMNHVYHHRGQLTVYLRLLGVPLPAVYGDSADERPMAPRGGA